jgi:hypothetical protein
MYSFAVGSLESCQSSDSRTGQVDRGAYSTLCCLESNANKVLAENVVEDRLTKSSIFIENLIHDVLLHTMCQHDHNNYAICCDKPLPKRKAFPYNGQQRWQYDSVRPMSR